MSNFYSFANEDRLKKEEDSNLYNLNTRTVLYNKRISNPFKHIVSEDENMRMDIISIRLFGSVKFVEELMVLNNIRNPFSIKEGDIINYLNLEDMNYLHGFDPDNTKNYEKLINKNKNTKIDPNRKINTGMLPSTKPSSMEQVQIDDVNKILKIMNTLQ